MALLTFLNFSFGCFTWDILLTESGNFCWLWCVVQGRNKVGLLSCRTSEVLFMPYSELYTMTASFPKLSSIFLAVIMFITDFCPF